jgi:DNA-binding NarL/FixJ family response regulator
LPHSATQAAGQDHHIQQNDDPATAARTIGAGVKGYITKNDDPARLPAAVKSVAEGGVHLHPELTRQIAFLRTGAKASNMPNLSPREFEILRLIAAGRTVAEIADQPDVSYRTIANNCTQLKHKARRPLRHGPYAHRH